MNCIFCYTKPLLFLNGFYRFFCHELAEFTINIQIHLQYGLTKNEKDWNGLSKPMSLIKLNIPQEKKHVFFRILLNGG